MTVISCGVNSVPETGLAEALTVRSKRGLDVFGKWTVRDVSRKMLSVPGNLQGGLLHASVDSGEWAQDRIALVGAQSPARELGRFS